jgi:DNA segregation ATPase FtsK/SpoIIIE, S-DNA-T family
LRPDLPAVPGADDIEPEIIDGEIVEDTPAPTPAAPVALRVVSVVRVVQLVQIVRVVVQHDRTKTAGRHLGYIPAGALVVIKRLWDSRTSAPYDRFMRAAEATGNHEAALDWEERRAEFRRDRHARRMDLLEFPLKVLLVLPKVLGSLLLLFIAAGILLAIATSHIAEAGAPIRAFAHVVLWTALFISVTWVAIAGAAVAIGLGILWQLGRTAGDGPLWARTSADPDADVTIDERLISQALEAMRIPQIRDYIKQGLPLQFVVPCRQEGRGTGAEIRLPKGVTAEKIARRRADFAAGVYRLPKEVWPSTGSEAAMLKLWIADKGALEEGAGPYPLLAEGFTDVFKGVPFGRTLRGDPVKIPVIGRNGICGGAPEQGKSNSARVVACGYTLDLITELRIYVPDANFDFDAFEPRCSRYLVGAEDEVIEAMLEEQELLKEELQKRGQLLRDYEVQEVTYEIAHAGVGLHPVFNLIEEAHIPITHKKHGKDFGQLLGENVKLCRKRGEHIFVSTQAPVRGAMPRDVTTNCTIGIAHALSDIWANDAILGPGAHSSGHRATELIPGTDRGIALCKGFASEARSEMVQAYRITTGQVPSIVQRAMTALAGHGLPVPGTARTQTVTSRDLLADLDQVLGSERVKLADIPARLRRLAPQWQPYRDLTGVQLREILDTADVRYTNTGNVPRLDPADLRQAIRQRGELAVPVPPKPPLRGPPGPGA